VAVTKRHKERPTIRYSILRVVIPDGGEYLEHEVQTITADQTGFERTAYKHGWPDPGADKGRGANVWLAFIGWRACKREGLIGDKVTFEDFEELVLECLPVGSGEEGDERSGGVVPPTLPAPDIGS
jgi:hypothetical protein